MMKFSSTGQADDDDADEEERMKLESATIGRKFEPQTRSIVVASILLTPQIAWCLEMGQETVLVRGGASEGEKKLKEVKGDDDESV